MIDQIDSAVTVHQQSTITCAECGFLSQETMPLNACQFSYRCPNCAAQLRPLAGDCCVFCSYADVQCPSKQYEEMEINGNNQTI